MSNLKEEYWFFLDSENNQHGPFSLEEMRLFLESKTISGRSFVWRPGMEQWTLLSNTELFSLFPAIKGTSLSKPEEITPSTSFKDVISSPVSVNNMFAWLLALSPAFIALLSLFSPFAGTIIAFPLILVLWVLDKREINHTKQGLADGNWPISIFLLTPLYLFLRAKHVDKKYRHAVVCILAIAPFLFIYGYNQSIDSVPASSSNSLSTSEVVHVSEKQDEKQSKSLSSSTEKVVESSQKDNASSDLEKKLLDYGDNTLAPAVSDIFGENFDIKVLNGDTLVFSNWEDGFSYEAEMAKVSSAYKKKWDNMTGTMLDVCASLSDSVRSDIGQDAHFGVALLDDRNLDNALFIAIDDSIVYDYVSDYYVFESEENAGQENTSQQSSSANNAQSEDVALSNMSFEEQNALRSALNYLSFMNFSRAGLIEQLSSEYGDGYSIEAATSAVNYLESSGLVDWKEQAVLAAKNYTEMMGFSRNGLIEQLTSEYGENYTMEEAEYAADMLGY